MLLFCVSCPSLFSPPFPLSSPHTFSLLPLSSLSPLQSYSMVSSPRGLALVISNVSFDPCAAPDLDSRKGGEVDEEVLRKVFTELDYIVTVRRDLTAPVTETYS